MEHEERNPERYKIIFQRYYPELVRHAFSVLQNLEAAEDVVQETFFQLAKNRVLERDLDNIGGYLHRAVHNNTRYWLRKQSRKLQAESESIQENILLHSDTELQEAALLRRVEQALSALPARQQAAFTLVYVNQLKYQDAADELGISINTLKTNLKLAMRNIRHKLLEYAVWIHPILGVLHYIINSATL